MTRALAALFAFLASLALGWADPARILADNKAAMGGAAWDQPAYMSMDGLYEGQGLAGVVHSLNDLKTGRNASTYKIGPAEGANGFDGKTPWVLENSGTVAEQKGGDALALAVNEAYRIANRWWHSDFGGAAIGEKDVIATAEGRYAVLSVTPPGGKPFEAWFDTQSHLLSRIVEEQGVITAVTKFSDYKRTGGVLLPHKFVIDGGLGAPFVQTVTVTGVTFSQTEPDSAFAPPQRAIADWDLGRNDQTTIPITILNNHVYGDVRVNGAGPFTFIFDTGAHNIITPSIARLLGLSPKGKLPGTGAGEAVVEGSIVNGLSLAIGSATLKDQIFYVFPIDDLSEIEGQALPGIVGFETFRRFVTRIDYGAGTLTLIDPEKFDPTGAGTPVPFTFNDHLPEVEGTFEGLPAKFDIDTGSRAELTITRAYAEAHGLRASHPKGVDALEGWGVGGPLTGYVTRGRSMALGSVEVGSVVASLNSQDKGAFAGAHYSGNVGGGILKRFIVTFDYGRQILYLKPRTGVVEDSGSYDRAGLWLNASDGAFRVVSVTRAAPAEEAGLVSGDIITAVDGIPSNSLNLSELRKRLRNDPPGTAVTFTVTREGKPATITMILRDLI